MRLWVALALVLLSAVLTYALTRPEPPLPSPPLVADTVYVDRIVQDTLWRERVRTVVRDQPNFADTIQVTTVDTVRVTDTLYVEPSWYLVSAELPTARGDTARYLLKYFGVDAGRLLTAERQERHPYPTGPLKALSVDVNGVNAAYGEWPAKRALFDLGDPFAPLTLLETAAVCGGSAALAKSAEAGLWCVGIKSLLELLP